MTKLTKILKRVLGITLEWILIFIFIFAFAIRSSKFQTYLAHIATDFLSKELKTKIKINSISIIFFDKIALDGVEIIDLNKDTLASLKTVYCTFDKLDTKKANFKLGKLKIESGTVKINIDKKGDFNYDFLVNYFSSDTSSSKTAVQLGLKEIELKGINFYYDDNRKGYSKSGMDYDHLQVKNIHLLSKNIRIDNDVIQGKMISFSTTEKCGFVLSNLSSTYQISKKGLKLKDLKISTPLSDINIPRFNLLMNDYTGYIDFVDSVRFDSKINLSHVNIKDVAYFATILEGMDEKVDFSAVISKRVIDMKISDMELKIGNKSTIKGDFNLPDYRNLAHSFLHERIRYAYIDLNDIQRIKLPVNSVNSHIALDEYSRRLKFIELNDFIFDGFPSEFVVASKKLNTSLGSFNFDNGIKFSENLANNNYTFEKSNSGSYDFKINQFNLGGFLDNSKFGRVDGIVFISGEASSLSDIKFTDIEGDIDEFGFMGYNYRRLKVEKGTLKDNVFESKIELADDNLKLNYKGSIDFSKNEHIDIEIDLSDAILNNLNLTTQNISELKSRFKVDLFDYSSNKINGTIQMTGLFYKENEKQIIVPDLTIEIDRNKNEDQLNIRSSILDAKINGKIDFSTIVEDFENQFSHIFPAIIKPKEKSGNQKKSINQFDYDITFKNTKDILNVFFEDLKISPITKLKGAYSSYDESFLMQINSSKIEYKNLVFKDVLIKQSLENKALIGDYSIKRFNLNDSISVEDLHFTTNGTQDRLLSEIVWNTKSEYDTKINWKTKILDIDKYEIDFDSTYFSIKDKKWELEENSFIAIEGKDLIIKGLRVFRESQFIDLDGKISNNDNDKLNYKINDLNLTDFVHLFGLPIDVSGTVNSWGYISNPYKNITYMGDANIQNLFLDNNEVGTVFVQSQWDNSSNSIGLMGDLIYKNEKTFSFSGDYLVNKIDNNLDFDLFFDKTDLKFTNAFMDPEVISKIEGQINGHFKVSGSLKDPSIDGSVDLVNAKSKVEILGVTYGFQGKIESDKYGFYINNMPVSDEEGNAGFLNGSVYHDYFTDWNFDLQFNLEDDYNHHDPFAKWKNSPLDKFLVLNTKLKEGDVYYGKAYATGNANIFGYADNLEITVNLKTRKDTKIIFPMFGTGEVEDENDLIEYIQKDILESNKINKIDLTGLTLDLNFDVTPDAKIRVDFDDKGEDVINATGGGKIGIKVSNTNDISMDGTYTINQGLYNFSLGTIKKKLNIQQGSISWTGSPYDARIDIQTYVDVNANFGDLTPDVNGVVSNTGTQNVQCYINLSESLMKPAISFDIKAPKVTDDSQISLLNRIKESNDELNRQFFSLLISQKFLPLQGSGVSGSGAALDVVTNQLNALLSQLSKGYKLKLNLGSGTTTLGVSKKIGDRVVINGTFGVENSSSSTSKNSSVGSTTTSSQSMLIGDVNVEYLINEAGTFRVNVFNESNDNTVIQQKSIGLFTQGAGIHYQEDFDNFQDFKLAQYTLDVFRSKSKKRYPIKKKKKQIPVPKE